MPETNGDETPDPTHLREEIEHELDELAEEVSEEESERLDKRDEAGVDEPS